MTVKVHLLVPNESGKIQGSSGRMFAVACNPEMTNIATPKEAGTGDPSCANCEACLKTLPEPEGEPGTGDSTELSKTVIWNGSNAAEIEELIKGQSGPDGESFIMGESVHVSGLDGIEIAKIGDAIVLTDGVATVSPSE